MPTVLNGRLEERKLSASDRIKPANLHNVPTKRRRLPGEEMQLMIADAKVRMDKDGRYSLNDLHKAAGNERRHEPSEWLSNQQTKEMIAALETTGNPVVKKEGRGGGTFVCKEMVYAYAMWISAEFMLRVIRAYDDLVEGRLGDAERIASRQAARLEAPFLTDAIKHRREVQGKSISHYHYSNEFDLINRVALGKSAKEFRAAHGLGVDDPLRDHLTKLEIACVQALQRADTTMIDMGMDYEKRKVELHKIYVTRHSAGLLAEVKRIES